MAKVRLDRSHGIAVLTLDDQARRNAVGLEMAEQIVAAIETAGTDPVVHALVVTGAGSAFCAGADRALLVAPDEDRLRRVYQAFLAVRSCPIPTVAAVNGPAVGAGLNLALACDVRLAGESALFDARFLQLPIHPGGGHLWMLQQLVGPQAAAAITLFDQPLSGRVAVRIGLAWSCVTDEQLIDAAIELCGPVARAPARLGRQIKRSLEHCSTIQQHAEAVEWELVEQLSSTRELEFLERMDGNR
jgi:enoyl-CoA hydratase